MRTRSALAEIIGIDAAAYGIHGLRRTKVSMAYKQPWSARRCQLLLGITS